MTQLDDFPAYVEQLMVSWSRLAIEGSSTDSAFHRRLHENTITLLGRGVMVEAITDEPAIFRVPPTDSQQSLKPEEAIPWVQGTFYCYAAGRYQLPRLLLQQTIDIGEGPILEVLPVNQAGDRLITIEVLDQ